MPFVYILHSEKLNRYYIGSTTDLSFRLMEHNKGYEKYTRTGAPWVCMFFHETETLQQARALEYRIKSWKDRRLIERIVRDRELLITK